MNYYSISDHCRWINGKSGSAIYDLKKGTVFAIDQEGTKLLSDLLLSEKQPSDSESVFINSLLNNHLLNNHEYPIADFKVEPRLRYVWLEITGRCNCRCIHCYGAFGAPKEYSQNELTLNEWKAILDLIISKGGEAIQIIGGEPLIHPDFDKILLHAKQIGFKRIDVFTNAFFLTEEIADLIALTGASVRVSLYGYNEASHDSITQHPGSFTKLDHGLDLLKERGIPVSIAVVLMQENQQNLQAIKEYILSKGLKFSGFDTVRKVTHSAQNSHMVSDENLLKERIITHPTFKTSVYDYSLSRKWNSCWYGKFAVTATGDIIPCIFARDIKCGNIRTDSFESIRSSLLSYWSITKDAVESCSDCEFRYACDDCRPLAMGEGLGLYGKYPRCTYCPSTCVWDS